MHVSAPLTETLRDEHRLPAVAGGNDPPAFSRRVQFSLAVKLN